jgi:regulatory protein
MKRPPASLRSQALALLARREHSRLELRNKLLAHARKLARAEQAAARPDGDTAGADPDPESLALEPFDADAWAAQVEAVLDGLGARGLQSDARFVESRVHARAARHGQGRIRLELARHGVELDAETARQLRETEFSRAREVWLRKFGSPAADAAGRARQMRFLAARGFGAEVIRRVVGGRDED